MTVQMAGPTKEDIDFCDADFHALAVLAKREFGLDLAESKKPLVYSRLSKRLKAHNLSSFKDYLAMFDTAAGKDERQPLISALTTNVTSFFREKHHFTSLTEECIGVQKTAIENGERFRVWSAGCSTGQEPYSIAMTILDAVPNAGSRNVKILATDIDPQVVEKAKKGEYSDQDAEALASEGKSRFISTNETGAAKVKDDLKSLITFAELNLIEDWPLKGPFDAIFCRNVAIYFDQDTQKRLWSRFSGLLKENGFLFIGHSERMSGPAQSIMIPAGITTYRKSAGTDTNPDCRK